MRRFLIDENISPQHRTQLLNHEPSLTVLVIGDEDAPPKSTPDPEILEWCEQHQFTLITNNRESMPQHLSDHLSAGHHVPAFLRLISKCQWEKLLKSYFSSLGHLTQTNTLTKLLTSHFND